MNRREGKKEPDKIVWKGELQEQSLEDPHFLRFPPHRGGGEEEGIGGVKVIM